MAASKGLGELLVREQLINIDQLESAKKEQKKDGAKLSSVLVKLGYVSEGQLTDFLSKQYSVPAIDLSQFEIDPEILKTVPRELCEKHIVIPVNKSANTLVLAMSDPTNIFVRDDIQFLTRCKVEAVVASETAILAAIEKHYKSKVTYESIMTEMESDVDAPGTLTTSEITFVDVDKGQADAPVVKFVNLILNEAIKMRASDIHIEPYEKRLRVRFRVDGTLYEKTQPPPGIASAVVSRLKIMSKLDISERRRPQDGRLKVRAKDNKEIDFRVSVLPTLHGEKVVMRLLDKENLKLDLSTLGLESEELEKLRKALHLPYGMILVTGPTGSGKSTTIYSALAELNKSDVNISTAEDPVEYNIEGINQVQMNADVDLNFASALRSFLRQDPDIIMVGEIRDFETAEIAFKAALTGHLVVSTLHTNDAASSINRLLNMGVEPFLVTAGVSLVMAQRLVRKICVRCKDQVSIEKSVLLDLGVRPEEADGFPVYKGRGCPACNDIGYKDRSAIYEVITVTESIKNLILQGASTNQIKQKAMEEGMITLRQNALKKLKQGVISIEEVIENSAKDTFE
ncbi:MAG: type IV-A pilus assembly ATPase PilB [Oligoflexia bacterium]|nr:type IV-A pilus assembly ATPase PilB [Oligoflexia bacterium]